MNIHKNLKQFIDGEGKNSGRSPDERYASFDYCFSYFQSFRRSGKTGELALEKNLELSCLQLSFYLASWGMLRGSSFLLEKSSRHYVRLITEISRFDKRIWDIDVDQYTNENIDLLLECKNMISVSLGSQYNASDTLITKIMLGVFGNIPAFDNYFNKGFGFYYCKKKQLRKLHDFYVENKEAIDDYSSRLFVYDFISGQEGKINYTKAKIIDMVGFIEGQNKNDHK